MSATRTDILRVALPKGRVLPALLATFVRLGLDVPDDLSKSRRLVVPIGRGRSGLDVDLEVLLLKNDDVPIYVEHGVADLGVSGTDRLYESGVSVFRPYTFPFGGCDIVLATKRGRDLASLRRLPLLRVASTYARFARDHFARLGWQVEIIPLSGSVELAPGLGLADAIVDLTETGNTLHENDLIAVDVIGRTHLKLIGNRALGRATTGHVERLIAVLKGVEEDLP